VASAAGIQFGNYRLIERLAHGGMAEVFLARQQGPQGFDRRVAIKRILPHLADSPDFLRMFLEEARLAASLTHANVVHIYELGKVGDHYFLAMEYIDGVHAGSMIERGGRERLPVALVARIGADACAGLNYVHNAVDSSGRPLHLVHRDISPPNLMISYDGVVKLMDFGIAKAVGQVEQTRPGIVKGKFAYMSPEQTTGETLDGRSDVFSLSLVMWELLAGRVALPRTDPVEAMTMIRDGKLPPLEQARPDVPPALAAVLKQGLQVHREHRPSAADLGAALEGFIKSSPELGTAMQLSEWVRRRFPRRPAPGEPLPPGAVAGEPEEFTDVAPGIGHAPDTDSGLQSSSLEVLVSVTGEHFAAAQPHGDYPGEVSDEASLSGAIGREMHAVAGHMDVRVPTIDPARAFLEEEDEDDDATVVTEPPHPEPLFAPTPAPMAAMTPMAAAGARQPPHATAAAQARRPTLTATTPHRATAKRPRRAVRIVATAVLAALVLGLVLWVLAMRNSGVLDMWLGRAPAEAPIAR
jgi:serine/threonine protein kinase